MIRETMGDDLLKEAYNLAVEFNKQENLEAHIALVIFSNGSKTIMELTDCSQITSSTYIRNKIYSLANLVWIAQNAVGSNLQSGLDRAKGILDNSTTGSKPENRHIIYATDGGNYTYTNSRGETSTTIYKESNGKYKNIGNGDSSGDYGSTTRETKMTMYYDETGDYATAYSKLMQEQDAIEARALRGYKWKDTNAANIEALVEAGELTAYDSDQITDLEVYPYTNLEVGTASAAMALKRIKAEGYNIHTIGYLYNYGFNDSGEITNRLFGLPTISFLKWTKNVGDLYFQNKTSITTDDLANIFSEIDNKIIQNVEIDSYIIDEMGFGTYSDGSKYDLDFVNDLDKISISLNNEVLDKVQIEENQYGFGADDSVTGGYKYILTYYPNGIDGTNNNECFKVDVNYEIGTGVPFKVEYEEVLNSEYIKTKNGEYGKYDKDGSKKYSGLKANNSATLYLTSGLEEKFKVPTLSYIVDNPEEDDVKPDEESKGTEEEQNSDYSEPENDNEFEESNKKIKTGDKILLYYINVVIAVFIGLTFYYKKNKRIKIKNKK